jgi:broad specificity phosphatase PhoE
MRDKPGDHLNQAGVTLARRVGETMGAFNGVITSTIPRAFETALAMGYAVHEQVEWLASYPPAIEAEMPPGGTWAMMARGAETGATINAFARGQADQCYRVLRAIPDGGRALLISHGGVVEWTTIGLLMVNPFAVDFLAWGNEVDYCEGARLTFDGDQIVSAERLWVKR